MATSGNDLRAFMQTRWGMSLSEVESVRSARLQEVSGAGRFYDAAAPDAAERKSFSEIGVNFLGYPSTVTYTFYKGRLESYHLFTEASDGEALDHDLHRYLKRVFGNDPTELDEGSSLKLLWQSRERIVNYWFLEDSFSLRPKYKAGFGVFSKTNQY